MSTEPLVPPADVEPQRRKPHGCLAVTLLAVVAVLAGGTSAVLARLGRCDQASPFALIAGRSGEDGDATQLRKRAAQAQKELDRVRPRGVYIVVDTYRNRLYLVENGRILRAAVCSTGKGAVLRDPRNGREWIFDTPMGERVVQSKTKNPVWAKPDWAFIEEGYLPPPPGSDERFDNASLGDYALYIGNGYIIHGTLFKSLLGRPVTHGCIRLGDEDLEFIYRHAPIGTRVYLY
jgi:L,D-transpeptidase YbiS